MSELIIELQRVSLGEEAQAVIREEFKKGGISHGRLAVGGITSAPEMIYFLWHEGGEVPVSMLFTRDALNEDHRTREAASVFLWKWKRRLV